MKLKKDYITKKEYGDYQTPFYFAYKVIEYAKSIIDINPDLIVEPTCGVGNFIKASEKYFPDTHIIGIDINKEYINELKNNSEYINVFCENIFEFDFNRIINDSYNEYLIIGNPPWITNTDLSKYNCLNKAYKHNLKNYGQFDAKTSMSNFDISENIILHIIDTFKKLNSTIIFLCKYNVAGNIFEYLIKKHEYSAMIKIIKFNAMKIFSINTTSYTYYLYNLTKITIR